MKLFILEIHKIIITLNKTENQNLMFTKEKVNERFKAICLERKEKLREPLEFENLDFDEWVIKPTYKYMSRINEILESNGYYLDSYKTEILLKYAYFSYFNFEAQEFSEIDIIDDTDNSDTIIDTIIDIAIKSYLYKITINDKSLTDEGVIYHAHLEYLIREIKNLITFIDLMKK